jgi:transposase-like protein
VTLTERSVVDAWSRTQPRPKYCPVCGKGAVAIRVNVFQTSRHGTRGHSQRRFVCNRCRIGFRVQRYPHPSRIRR